MARKIDPPDYHRVDQGDSIIKLAHWYRLQKWQTIWDHAKNADLKAKRKNPHILLPGDLVFIPAQELKHESAATEQRHSFKANLNRPWLRLVLRDDKGNAIANAKYTLVVDGTPYNGTTKDDGLIEHLIASDSETGTLTLDGSPLAFEIQIGHLDPLHDDPDALSAPVISGVQARLANLGYSCGPIDGIRGPKTTAAIARFQHDSMGRENSDGQLDDDTLRSLRTEYGA